MPIIETKPLRYQTLIERSITARGFGTEKYYVIEIAGPNTGQFSVLDVLANANLSGRLDPVLLNAFVPTIG